MWILNDSQRVYDWLQDIFLWWLAMGPAKCYQRIDKN